MKRRALAATLPSSLAVALLAGLAAVVAAGCPSDPAPRLRLWLFADEGQNPILQDVEPEPY